jgi:hypothetical protein
MLSGVALESADRERAASESSKPYCVIIVPICATSKSAPLMLFSVFNSSSFQRGSGAPLMYQFEPLSASIIP